MNYGLAFSPFVSWWIFAAIAAAAVLLAGLLLASRTRGAIFRALALLVGLLALANPSFTSEEREPLSSVVAVVVDKSASQSFGERAAQTEAARAALAEKLGALPGVEVRTILSDAAAQGGVQDGTRLFSALSAGLADVPPERVAGAIMITDGRVEVDGSLVTELGTRVNPKTVIIDHTEVAASLEGQGAGRQLLDAAVKWARETGSKFIPVCPYAKAQFEKDPSIRDVLST